MENKLLFALDIGTRSVFGIVGENTGSTIRLLQAERREHHTRAMLDGQIHDVPEVANILREVKDKLEEACGPLKKVSVAAAGRALCTIKASAEIEAHNRGILTAGDEHALELAAIQSAQHQLATSNMVSDPTSYYCVGYSVIGFTLDDTQLKTLIGQRGKTAAIELIATFLPRQVIDSLQSALKHVDLEMATLTLEPIAAINILIPPTMRHLNLALVDVGAGTSDVAITRDGSVIGYGMVPCAGDEITEAISQKYLLDFNVAETVKRQLGNIKNKKVAFTDILGASHKIPTAEITTGITATVAELAQLIAAQILSLNAAPPQAVLLVGGGSLTPLLPEALAQALDIPATRVAIRRPDAIEGIADIPASLCAPDTVTPLGILKLSAGRSLNFTNVTLNDQELHLFNLGQLTVADALLAAGMDIRGLHGRPGMGITVNINGHTQFFPGSYGKPCAIQLNGEDASFTHSLQEKDAIKVTKGIDGLSPVVLLRDAVTIPAPISISINGNHYELSPQLLANGQSATPETQLTDRDHIICRLPSTLGEALTSAGFPPDSVQYLYYINETERTYRVCPQYTINGNCVQSSSPIKDGDSVCIEQAVEPTIGDLLGVAGQDHAQISITVNGAKCSIPLRRYTILLNDKTASLTDKAPNASSIMYSCQEQSAPMISDVLLAADFNPQTLTPGSKVEILLNHHKAEYISPVKNGDAVEIKIEKPCT
jgi:cell division protein FtsA